MSSESLDIDRPESWLAAKRIARKLTPIPPSVTESVKVLWKNHTSDMQADMDEIMPRSRDIVRRMDKSAMLKMPLYFAAQSLYEEEFQKISEDDTSRALLDILRPGQFAAFLAIVYMHRRLNKLCDNDQWKNITDALVLHMEIGHLAGSNIQDIGPAIGCYASAIPYIAQGALLHADEDQYTKYRNTNPEGFSLEAEHERFGCDHTQVAGCLTNLLNFGYKAEDVAAALRLRAVPSSEVPSDLLEWRGIAFLVDSVKGDPKLEELNAEGLQLTDGDLLQLKSIIDGLLMTGTTFDWMYKGAKR